MTILLQIFAKAPTPGRVKTRLARCLGAAAAARLHTRLLLDTLQRCAGPHTELWCAPHTGHPLFQACRRHFGVTLQRQRGAELGARMAAALDAGLRHASAVLLIGSDCPSVGPKTLARAATALQSGAAVVLGAAADGGYVLIGLRRPQPSLFTQMPWGTAQVLALTVQRLQQAGLTWQCLDGHWDVDRPADWRRWRALATQRSRLPTKKLSTSWASRV